MSIKPDQADPAIPVDRPRRSPAEQTRLDDTLRDMLEHRVRFNGVLGVRVDALNPDGASMSFAMREDLIGHASHGRLHGGVTASVLDTAGGMGVMIGLAERFCDELTEQIVARFLMVGTIDLRIDYLRPGLGRRFHASVEVTRLGRRIGSTQMRLVNDEGLLIATASGTYAVS